MSAGPIPAATFPGRSIIESFAFTEGLLVDALRFIPYTRTQRKVWSPRLATIILEACSQMDSLWQTAAKLNGHSMPKKCTIADHFGWFGKTVCSDWTVFFGGEQPEQVSPFKRWKNLRAYASNDYNKWRLAWWTSYNKLKHNRWENRERATLQAAVLSVAPLFLAILRCEYTFQAAIDANWISARFFSEDMLSAQFAAQHYNEACAESALFAYPFGCCGRSIQKHDRWAGPASHRFRNWFRDYQQG